MKQLFVRAVLCTLALSVAGCATVREEPPAPPSTKIVDTPDTPATSAAPIPLFQEQSVIRATITASFPLLQETRDFIYASIDVQGRSIPAMVRVRGNYSFLHCVFPKLALMYLEDNARGSVFEHSDAVRLNTHCNGANAEESSEAGFYGREINVYREYFLYRIYTIINPQLSLRVRKAKVTYRSPDPQDGFSPLDDRDAFFIEDIAAFASQRGLMQVPTPKNYRERIWIDRFDKQLLTTTYLLQALALHDDWRPKALHNVIGFVPRSQGNVPGAPIYSVPYDFDQAGIVTDTHSQVEDPYTTMEKILNNGLEEQYFTRDELTREYQRWLCNFKEPLYAALENEWQQADIDEAFYLQFKNNLDMFFGFIRGNYFGIVGEGHCGQP